MKKTKIFLMLAIIASALVLSGCAGSDEIRFDGYQNANNEVNAIKYNGKYYLEDFGNWIRVQLTLGNNILDYKSWSLQLRTSNGNRNGSDWYGSNACKTNCSTQINSAGIDGINLFAGANANTGWVPNMVAGKTYNVRFTIWSGEGYTGTKKTIQLPDLVTSAVPSGGNANTSNISVANIRDNYLKPNGMTYYNTVNGVATACSSYGLSDTAASIPACIALSQQKRTGIDCVDFAKEVYKAYTGTDFGSFYSNMNSGTHYTDKNGDTSGLSTSNVYFMAQSGGGKHASIVYYNTQEKTWYAVGGGFTENDEVWNQTLKKTLSNSGKGWTYYTFKQIG